MDLNITANSLARNLGILGITLPFVLWIGDCHLAPSISHYYYTDMGIYFTGVLFAFGLFLFGYKGYKSEGEPVTDNIVTNVGGFLAIVVALIPTSFNSADPGLTFGGPNAHTDALCNTVHLVCAATFFIIMGWMALFRFTKSGKEDKWHARRYWIYFASGVVVWLCIAFLGIEMLLDEPVSPYSVFIAELIALVAFGIAWLTKSQVSSLTHVGLVSEQEVKERKAKQAQEGK